MSRILIYAQEPPPVHGQSVMVGLLLTALRESGQRDLARDSEVGDAASAIQFVHVNPRLSEGLEDIGRWSLRKMSLVFRYIFEAIGAGWRHRLDSFYFVPAPAKRSAIYRDWCVLFFCRPFFPQLVLHWHCIGQPEFMDRKFTLPERLISRFLYGRAALSICISNYSRAEAAYFGSRNAVVIPNGIHDPCPRFDEEVWPERVARASTLASVWSRQAAEPVFYQALFLSGRMTAKGLFDAMAAVTLANRRLAEMTLPLRVCLTVAGSFEDDAERTRFDQAARELNATQLAGEGAPLVINGGWADEEKKKHLYRRADCFIFPTTYPAESFGLVLAEAMAHGCAVVTTRWQAVPEVLPGGYPNLVEPHDIPEMAEALLRCAAQSASRELRDYFLARFTKERFAEAMVRALSQL